MRPLIYLFLFLPLVCQSEIYKWVDENGRTHFGDSPDNRVKAEKVTVEVTSYEYVTVENVEFFKREPKKPRAKTVTMYSTSWCGYCKKARQHFQQNNIPFTELDIEKDQQAKKEYDALGGKGVPVILIGKKRMNGFSASRFDSIYKL